MHLENISVWIRISSWSLSTQRMEHLGFHHCYNRVRQEFLLWSFGTKKKKEKKSVI